MSQIKTVIRAGTETPLWIKGSNAVFAYTTFVFRGREGDVATCGSAGHDHSSHNHSDHGECKSKHSQKPTRVQIGDSALDNRPFELRIGMGFAVAMFEACVKSMLVGESAKFMIMPGECNGYASLEKTLRDDRKATITGIQARTSCCSHAASVDDAYPDLKGIEEEILELNITLIAVHAPGSFDKELWEMTHEEKYAEAPKRKDEGGVLFGEGRYVEASEKYRRTIMLLESIILSAYMIDAERESSGLSVYTAGKYAEYDGKNPQPLKLYALLQASRMNFAICGLKLKTYDQVIGQCTEVLKKDNGHIKALFSRAKSYLYIGRDLELAEADFRRVRLLIANSVDRSSIDSEIRREESLLAQKKMMFNNQEKRIYSKLFSQ